MDKNLHLLPTDKPSRLYLTTKEYIFEKEYSLSTDECQNKHIYITSDEEIKEGDWFYGLQNQILKATSKDIYGGYETKIILTTDQDLINDGVQAIDDEFLEWFVKNPSCEWVNFEKEHDDTVPYLKMRHCEPYKIIIPKEESKQETTLEKTAEKYANDWEEIHPKLNFEAMTPIAISKIDFIEGAKWQQEQIYNHIKELYDNENITGFSKRAYAQCLDIIEQF